MVKKSARRTRRTHPPVFKTQVALAAVREDKTLAKPAKQFELHPNQITDWKRRLLEHATDAFDGGAESRPRPFGNIFRVRRRASGSMRVVFRSASSMSRSSPSCGFRLPWVRVGRGASPRRCRRRRAGGRGNFQGPWPVRSEGRRGAD